MDTKNRPVGKGLAPSRAAGRVPQSCGYIAGELLRAEFQTAGYYHRVRTHTNTYQVHSTLNTIYEKFSSKSRATGMNLN